MAELERPIPRPGRFPGRHHQHSLPAQINGRVFGTAGGAPALPTTASNLLHWLGDISAGPECTVEFFFPFFCVVSQLYMLYIVFFFCLLGGVSCSKWLKCVSVWGHVRGKKSLCLSRSVKLWNTIGWTLGYFLGNFTLFLTNLKAWVLRESVKG